HGVSESASEAGRTLQGHHWAADGLMETCGRCNAPLSPEAGERRQQWVGGFGRRKDAEEALGDVMPSVKSRTYRPPTNETIAEFLRAWLPAMPDLKATTREQYEITVEKYLVPEVGR